MIGLPKFFIRRNRPVRSKSRWRKVLDKRYRKAPVPGVIVDVDRRRPFMTVNFFPKTEEDHRWVQDFNLRTLMVAGIGIGPMMLTDRGRLERMLAQVSEG